MESSSSRKLSHGISIVLWTVFSLVFTAAVFLVLFLWKEDRNMSEQIENEKMYEEKVALLRLGNTYHADSVRFHIHSVRDEQRAKETRDYFNLDSIIGGASTTWEKTLALASFVASNIPHANQTQWPERLNAISLWEYTREVEPGFNCRLHSIMLYELLVSAGIEATYITCIPEDQNDVDCHVVNQVWLPELGKWAMVDSDFWNYASDEDGTPLSLCEIRDRYIAGEKIYYHQDFGEGSCQVDYYYAYMAKNTYWFTCWESLHYDQEPYSLNPDPGRFIILVPDGYKTPPSGWDEVVTHDDGQFWAAP